MLNNAAHHSPLVGLYAFGRPGFLGCAVVGDDRSLCTEDLGCRAWRSGPRPSGACASLRVRRVTLRLGRVLSQRRQWLLSLAGWLFLPPRGCVLCVGGVSVDMFSGADEPAVAEDDGCRFVGVTGPSAVTATEHRLGFTVVPVAVSGSSDTTDCCPGRGRAGRERLA